MAALPGKAGALVDTDRPIKVLFERLGRCFEYNSRLILHYDPAVFTTVLYLALLAAVRMLDTLPPSESADSMATLLDLAGQR